MLAMILHERVVAQVIATLASSRQDLRGASRSAREHRL
jgi:hypothetical protein